MLAGFDETIGTKFRIVVLDKFQSVFYF